ncbi:MAG: hypothetical protein MUP81_06490 [Dehalococcoidia bacterium]|nr:hypothetical protein [Dehalococcoidia bacterium]
MNIEERLELNKQKLNGIQARLSQLEQEKQELLQEALRLDGELRILNEQVAEEKEGETKP